MRFERFLLATIIAVAVLGCSERQRSAAQQPTQTPLGNRVKSLVEADGLYFKDLNDNGQLDPYEDWRLTTDERIEDLVGRMTTVEKAGMLLIPTLNAAENGELPDDAEAYVHDEHITRFIFRNPIVPDPNPSVPPGRSGLQITPRQAAEYTNAVQQLAESTRLGIPVVFKSNARNHYEQDARPGINLAAGSFSTWPKEAGLAATRDLELIREFADIMRQEHVKHALEIAAGGGHNLLVVARLGRARPCWPSASRRFCRR